MGRKKKKRRSKSALADRVQDFFLDSLSAILAGLITATIVKWFGW